MNALHHYARAQRLHGQAYAAEADYYTAIGSAENAAFYRAMADKYIDRANEIEQEDANEPA